MKRKEEKEISTCFIEFGGRRRNHRGAVRVLIAGVESSKPLDRFDYDELHAGRMREKTIHFSRSVSRVPLGMQTLPQRNQGFRRLNPWLRYFDASGVSRRPSRERNLSAHWNCVLGRYRRR